MRSRAVCVVFAVLLVGSVFLSSGADAKKYGGGSSSGSSSRSSSPVSRPAPPSPKSYGNTGTKPSDASKKTLPGYGNTGTKTPPGSSAPPSGYGNTATSSQGKGGPSGSQKSQLSPMQQKMNRSYSKEESERAYRDYKIQQSKFQMGSRSGDFKPSVRETTTINSIQSRVVYGSSSDYYARRTVFYNTYSWSPPVYVYRSYNSFGIWDAMILWFMLDHINDAQYAAMYYNHRDDPGMQKFRAEVERLSTENAELKAKLAKMDESAKSLEQQGQKPDPSYVPPDADSIALAADIATKGAPKPRGFPWVWAIVILGAAVGIVYLRRRT